MKSSPIPAVVGNLWLRSIGWQAKSIGGLGAPTGISAVYVLMEREVT
jgi:hypothetical protein